MAGILEGVKIVDMGHVIAIPAAGAMLGDWGAEVTKVEPLSGEMARGMGRPGSGGVHWTFQMHNRNKKGLALDLKKESGKEILYKLVQRSDVFMSNYELKTLKKLKMDYASLSQANPQLIYAILTGYGTVGPDKDERGFDYSAAWARSGMQHLIGEPGSPPPPQRAGMMDRVATAHTVAGILAGLLHREKTGRGQELEFSLYHMAVWILASDIQATLIGSPIPKHDRTKPRNPIWNTYRTKDNRWIWLSMLQPDLQWPGFCRAIERPELENDQKFDTIERREQNNAELIGILDEIFSSKNVDEWEKCLRENNCIYGRVQTPLEVTTDPQALANDFFVDMHHPDGETMKLVTTPINFSQNPASIRTPAPEVGQHTEEILLELGYSWDDIARFKEQRVIL